MSASEIVTIEAHERTGRGKNESRKLRKSGKIPANLLTQGQSKALELDPKWLSKAWKNGKTFNLSFNGVTKPVEIKELQICAPKRSVLHVDLMYK